MKYFPFRFKFVDDILHIRRDQLNMQTCKLLSFTLCFKVISCGEPPAPPNSKATVLSYDYNGVAILSCAEGYEMEGEDSIVCLSNTSWSTANFSCNSKFERTAVSLLFHRKPTPICPCQRYIISAFNLLTKIF